MEPIRILLVDDQDIIRHGLKLILEQQPDLRIVGQAGDGEQAVIQARALAPDIVLMDIKMPKQSGIQATRQITRALRDTRVILMTTYNVDDWVFEGIRAGAQGYLLKDTASANLHEVIRSVHRGESQIDPSVAGRVLTEFRRLSAPGAQTASAPQGTEDDLTEDLTPREAEVLQLIAQGASNKDVAERLSLSEGTVRNYVSAIMAKLHARDRTQMVIKAAQKKIVKLS